jgi:hypothetical protein
MRLHKLRKREDKSSSGTGGHEFSQSLTRCVILEANDIVFLGSQTYFARIAASTSKIQRSSPSIDDFGKSPH